MRAVQSNRLVWNKGLKTMPAGATYTAIATQTASGSTGSISFTSIPSGYTDLIVVIRVLGSAADFDLRINNDSGSNYSITRMYGDGSSTGAGRATNQTSTQITIGGANPGVQILSFNNYSDTTTYKTMLQRLNITNYVGAAIATWRSTSAINRLDFIAQSSNNLQANSTYTLYGILAA
jgi:hypothetical protein